MNLHLELLTNDRVSYIDVADTRPCLCDNSGNFIAYYIPAARTLLVHIRENLSLNFNLMINT